MHFQAKFSQIEDDNRNMSSRVGSLAASCSADLQLIRQQVEALSGQVRAASSHLQDAASSQLQAAASSQPQVAAQPPSLQLVSAELQLPPSSLRVLPEVDQQQQSSAEGPSLSGLPRVAPEVQQLASSQGDEEEDGRQERGPAAGREQRMGPRD